MKLSVKHWQDPVNAVLGVWLTVAPWALAFSAISIAKTSLIATGIVIAALALWVLRADKDYGSWWRKRLAN